MWFCHRGWLACKGKAPPDRYNTLGLSVSLRSTIPLVFGNFSTMVSSNLRLSNAMTSDDASCGSWGSTIWAVDACTLRIVRPWPIACQTSSVALRRSDGHTTLPAPWVFSPGPATVFLPPRGCLIPPRGCLTPPRGCLIPPRGCPLPPRLSHSCIMDVFAPPRGCLPLALRVAMALSQTRRLHMTR